MAARPFNESMIKSKDRARSKDRALQPLAGFFNIVEGTMREVTSTIHFREDSSVWRRWFVIGENKNENRTNSYY